MGGAMGQEDGCFTPIFLNHVVFIYHQFKSEPCGAILAQSCAFYLQSFESRATTCILENKCNNVKAQYCIPEMISGSRISNVNQAV